MISGDGEPHAAPPVGHIETVTLRAINLSVILLKDTSGSPPWLRCRQRCFYRQHWRLVIEGGRTAVLLPHSLLSARAMFPTQSAHYFIKPRTQECSHATGRLQADPSRLWHSTDICAGWYLRQKPNKMDIRFGSFSFSAGTADTVSGGCNTPPPTPPRRHGNPCARCRGVSSCSALFPPF